jgi:hypothetical protein
LAVNLIYPIWVICFYNNHYARLSYTLNSYCFSLLYHYYLLYLFLKFIRVTMGNKPMSFREAYFLQSFRAYINVDTSEDKFTKMAIEKIE